MDFVNSLIQIVVVFMTIVSAPVKDAVLPTPSVNQMATPSGVVVNVSPAPSPQAEFKEDSPKEKNSFGNMVRAEDYFDYMNQRTTFYIDIPKKGGRISGKITGLCNGEVTGEFNGQTSDKDMSSDRHDLQGEASGVCKIGFIPVPASAKFFGEVSFSNKRVVLTADIEKPIQIRAYPVMRIW